MAGGTAPVAALTVATPLLFSMADFTSAFERLVVLLRDRPDESKASEIAAESAAAVRTAGVRIEAGFEGSSIPTGTTLQGRLLARAIDWIEVESGAAAHELLAMARALASDDLPLPPTRTVHAALIPLPIFETAAVIPGLPAAQAASPISAVSAETDDEEQDPELDRLIAAVGDAIKRRGWAETLDRAERLLEYAAEAPKFRRLRIIAARRALPHPVLQELLQHALRHPEDQTRTASILSRIGPEGYEVMVDAVAETDSLAARKFLHDALARTPEAYPLIAPLLRRTAVHQVRHGAMLLGRLGDARAVGPLIDALQHADEGVRREAARALAPFDDGAARAALQEALAHPSATTRSDVAAAIGFAGRAPLAPALMAAFRGEKQSLVRRAIATAAARIGTPPALDELVLVALARRGLLRPAGYPAEVRLDAVAGLAAANTPAARRCLDRIVRDGDRPVRDAADRALSMRRRQ